MYKSLKEIREVVSGKEISHEIFLEEKRLFDIHISTETKELLVDILTKAIGDSENSVFLHLYSWMRENGYENYTIYILLPEDFERFTSVYISTLYLFHEGLHTTFFIIGHQRNGRIYELSHLMHSGLLSQDKFHFFRVGTYYDHLSPIKVFGKNNTEAVDKFVISEKYLPLISINIDNFDYYFTKPLRNLLIENQKINVSVKDTYKEISKDFLTKSANLTVDELKKKYLLTHLYKLLDNIHCLYYFYQEIQPTEKNRDSEYYQAVFDNFIKDILDKPIYNVLILLLLLSEKNIRNNYIQIFNENQKGASEKPQNKTLIETANEETIKQYIYFLKGQVKTASDIFTGIYELAKNTVEHSTEKRGVLTARIISENNLFTLKNENQDLWNAYKHTNDSIDFLDTEARLFMDISIVDSGTVGIIEKSLMNMSDEGWRGIPGVMREEDRNKILCGLEACSSDKEKETEFLFNMYYNPNSLILQRQADYSQRGLGLSIFTQFIINNHGVFSVQTNRYQNPSKTISFSFFNKKDLAPAVTHSNNPFGTAYNIVFPVINRKESFIVQKNRNEKSETALSKVVFEKMLTLKRFEVAPEEPCFSLGELNRLNRYIIKDIKEDSLKIVGFSLDSLFVDKSILYRTINLLFSQNTDLSSIIIKNISKDSIKGLIDLIYTSSALTEKKRSVLLITDEDKSFIIFGKTKEECINSNSLARRNNEHIEIISGLYPEPEISKEIEKELEAGMNDNILFAEGQILQIDVFERDEEGISLFEKRVKENLDRPLDGDDKLTAYKWENTHLKIGAKLHLKDFVYGKKLFQRNKDASTFAYTLSQEIFFKIKEEVEKGTSVSYCYTLVGYGYYSELLVSRTCGFIRKLIKIYGFDETVLIEYMIVKDEDKIRFPRYFQDLNIRNKKDDNCQERLVVIVPISSTLTTCLKIENEFYSELAKKRELDCEREKYFEEERFKFIDPFYSIVIVGDHIDYNKRTINFEKEEDEKFDAVKLCWKHIDFDTKIIRTYNREREDYRNNKFNIYIKSEWNLPHKCQYCFPSHNNFSQERPLFVTDKVAVTPTLVFDPPQWYETKDNVYFQFKKDKTRDIEFPVISENMVNQVHYAGNNKHFNYYCHYIDLIDKNRDKIKKWAKKLQENEDIQKDKVLLIAPDKSENGEFLHLINRYLFNDRANIVKFDQYSDYYLNFERFFGNDIKNSAAIYYVDNLISSGKTFLSLSDMISNLQCVEDDAKPPIKGMFCLLNQLDYECLQNVQKRLKTGIIYSFINLNVPTIVNPGLSCPLCDEKALYEQLKEKTSLDAIKLYYTQKELPYYGFVNKDDLVERNLPYKEENYTSTLLKIVLIHYINKAFSEKDPTCFIEYLKIKGFDSPDKILLNDFIKKLREYIAKYKKCLIDEDIINDLKLKANLIKVLSQYSFRRHRGIYISVFNWVLNDLMVATQTILSISYNDAVRQTDFIPIRQKPTGKNLESFINTFNYLRLLIKYAGVLNIAFLLDKDFLSAMNKLNSDVQSWTSEGLFEGDRKARLMKYSFDNFKIYCAAHIVRSLYGNEPRAIKFEENIDLVFEQIKEKKDNTTFIELLILENTSVIRQTIDNLKGIDEDKIHILFEKNDTRIADYNLFSKTCSNYIKDKIDILKNTYILKKGLDNGFEDTPQKGNPNFSFEEEAKKIIKLISSIVAHNVDSGGALLLYKYQDVEVENRREEKDKENSIVIANVGDDTLYKYFTNDTSSNSLSEEVLNQKNYLKESVDDKTFYYPWTNYIVFKDGDTGEWIGQDGKCCSNYTEVKKLDKKARRIFFIRISNFTLKNNLVGNAVFVLYDNEEISASYSLHRIRFIHVLRNSISQYFKRKYENDSFREWIKQKEKSEYIFSLNHGTDIYKSTFNYYFKQLADNDMNRYLKISMLYMANKIYLLSVASKINPNESSYFESISVKKISDEIEEKYKYILSFYNNLWSFLPKRFVVLENKIADSDLNFDFKYPKTIIDELIFELFFNIRKHVITVHYRKIGICNNPLKICIDLKRFNTSLYLTISNNFYFNEVPDINRFNNSLNKNKNDGLNLLHNVLFKSGIGNLFVSAAADFFTVWIPLKNNYYEK